MSSSPEQRPEGIFSLLDTDAYKMTMQSAVLKYFPQAEVTYALTNRTPDMKLSRGAFKWLQKCIDRFANITISDDEIDFLRDACPYLSETYLQYLQSFRMRPDEQVHCSFTPDADSGGHHHDDDDADEDVRGDLAITISGLWVETILYEVPVLALISEAYFKFCDRDWTYEGQAARAKDKFLKLMEHGCMASEFGCRRRRDYHTQDLVVGALVEAQKEGEAKGFKGKVTGTSNMHMAMKHGTRTFGTVGHEWYMGIAAITNNYPAATETALSCWIGTFGKGVLGIALTDTFGTSHFLEKFKLPISPPPNTSSSSSTEPPPPPPQPPTQNGHDIEPSSTPERYADAFTGVRQDSGDPLDFIKLLRTFYDTQGITTPKTLVFSDSLNIDTCLEYRAAAEDAGFNVSFGVGTYFTNDFVRASDGRRSVPLNIVIKLSSANGRPAVKLSDNVGKNTGDEAVVADVKRKLGYTEQEWSGGDERTRWGVGGR